MTIAASACAPGSSSASPDTADLDRARTVYQLRVVIAGISPLIWRRLQVSGDTSLAGLHTIVQTMFGWSDEHLHHFVIHGVEYGLYHEGGRWFRDNARSVRLDGLGLRPTEKFTYTYNYFAPWEVRLRLEQISAGVPDQVYPRCTGGRRAGPPEQWEGPWEYLERTRRWRIFEATQRAVELLQVLLEADEHQDFDSVGICREELAELVPLLGLEHFERHPLNKTLAGLSVSARGAT